jgi:hypothetical protein
MKNKLEILISNLETRTDVLNINDQKGLRSLEAVISDLDIRYSIFPPGAGGRSRR